VVCLAPAGASVRPLNFTVRRHAACYSSAPGRARRIANRRAGSSAGSWGANSLVGRQHVRRPAREDGDRTTDFLPGGGRIFGRVWCPELSPLSTSWHPKLVVHALGWTCYWRRNDDTSNPPNTTSALSSSIWRHRSRICSGVLVGLRAYRVPCLEAACRMTPNNRWRVP